MGQPDKDVVLEDRVNRVLTFLHLCEDDRHRISVPLKSMDGAIPLLISGQETDARSGAVNDFTVLLSPGPPGIWPIDVVSLQDAGEGFPEGSLQFNRTRSISAKEARLTGASLFAPRMLMEEVVGARPDGTTKSGKAPYAFLGGRWVMAAPHAIEGGSTSIVEDRAIRVALGLALSVRYEWTVWIGHGEGPRVRFLSDPLGAREVFRLRDLPAGRDRRAALRHWVSAHARKRRGADAEAEQWIARHLRGATDFVWNGLRCRIEPPAYDVERLQKRA